MNKENQIALLEKITSVLKLHFRGETLDVENTATAAFVEELEDFFAENGSQECAIGLDEADLALLTEHYKRIEGIWAVIDDWQGHNEFSQKIDRVVQSIKDPQYLICVVNSNDQLLLKEVEYVMDKLGDTMSPNASTVFGFNYMKQPTVRMEILCLIGQS